MKNTYPSVDKFSLRLVRYVLNIQIAQQALQIQVLFCHKTICFIKISSKFFFPFPKLKIYFKIIIISFIIMTDCKVNVL